MKGCLEQVCLQCLKYKRICICRIKTGSFAVSFKKPSKSTVIHFFKYSAHWLYRRQVIFEDKFEDRTKPLCSTLEKDKAMKGIKKKIGIIETLITASKKFQRHKQRVNRQYSKMYS